MWIYDIAGVLWREARELGDGRVMLEPCTQSGERTLEGFVRIETRSALRASRRALIKK